MEKTVNNFPKFINGVRLYQSTPPAMKRTQKFSWKDIPVGYSFEISAKSWPAETKRKINGTSNAAAAAYQWAKKHGVKFQVEHLAGGNVRIYNWGAR